MFKNLQTQIANDALPQPSGKVVKNIAQRRLQQQQKQ